MDSVERLESPDRDCSQGYGSEESLSDKFDLQLHGQHSGEDSGFKVDPAHQIFANRNLNLAKIRCFGFDMDYTLCEYISPEFDQLAFSLAKNHLVEKLGYPQEVLDLTYNPRFPVRGLWFDRELGNLLKVDQFGKILRCIHGFRDLQGSEIRNLYPHKIQRKDEARVFVMNTLFNLAETHLIASLVDYYDRREKTRDEKGWTLEGKCLTFKKLFQDLRAAIDYIHLESMELKKRTVENLPRYVKKDAQLPLMLRRLKDEGRQVFLLTNSDWWYTRHVMSYLLGEQGDKQDDWLRYFHLTIVNAAKPRFFSCQPPLHRVDTQSGGVVDSDTPLPSSQPVVYSGGNHAVVTKLLGCEGPDVMYCGDHLHADVVKCRKLCEWRTLLVVPELEFEVSVTRGQHTLLAQLHRMETLLHQPEVDLEEMKVRLWECVNQVDRGFGQSGSLFRAGSRLTYFGSQMLAWADVYTGSVTNLAGYSVKHRFLSPPVLLPHEETASRSGLATSESFSEFSCSTPEQSRGTFCQ